MTLVCWGFSTEGVNFGADRIVGINTLAEAVDAVGELARGRRATARRSALESTAPALPRRAAFARPGSRPWSVDRLIEDMRLIKTPEELELIRRSTAIIEDCVDELYGVLEVGMSRADLMHRARTMLVERGASGISHLTFTFGGSNPEIEIAEPLERRLARDARPRRDRRRLLLGQPALRVHGRASGRAARDLRHDGLDRGRCGRDAHPRHARTWRSSTARSSSTRSAACRRSPASRTRATTSAWRPRSAGSPRPRTS